MTNNPRVQELLNELLDSDATPEQVCVSCPELLPGESQSNPQRVSRAFGTIRSIASNAARNGLRVLRSEQPPQPR
jgi:hypothetical protein